MKWNEKLGLEHDWNHIFKSMNGIKDIKFKWFQIRVVTRILGTNITLYHMNIRNDNLCSFCHMHRESIEHLLFTCDFVMNFWNELKHLIVLNKCVDENFVIDNSVALFGYCNASKKDSVCYYILLSARFYVYRCRCSNQIPNLWSFIMYLSDLYVVIRFISMKNQTVSKFDKEWEKWKCILFVN